MYPQSFDIHNILKRYNLKPNPRFGQNFLVDQNALQRVIDAAEITHDDLILEVGAGLGSLTYQLASIARNVVAVELDKNFFQPLNDIFRDFKNIHLFQGDILNLELSKLLSEFRNKEQRYKVVANIPYYITSNLLRHLLEAKPPPSTLVLTVQKEVAERICATPPNISLLTLSVQVYGKAKISCTIPAGAFYPIPKVDSAVVRVDVCPRPWIPQKDIQLFFWLAKAGFSQKRKTLRNALAGGLHWKNDQVNHLLSRVNIDPMRRAETLSLLEWKDVVNAYKQVQNNDIMATEPDRDTQKESATPE